LSGTGFAGAGTRRPFKVQRRGTLHVTSLPTSEIITASLSGSRAAGWNVATTGDSKNGLCWQPSRRISRIPLLESSSVLAAGPPRASTASALRVLISWMSRSLHALIARAVGRLSRPFSFGGGRHNTVFVTRASDSRSMPLEVRTLLRRCPDSGDREGANAAPLPGQPLGLGVGLGPGRTPLPSGSPSGSVSPDRQAEVQGPESRPLGQQLACLHA
jgi:hypothetical protein